MNYNIVDETKYVFPRYYSIGAAEKEIRIKSMYLVELDTLQCQLPYTTVSIGGSFRCALECHEECTEHGCLKVNKEKYFSHSVLPIAKISSNA